MQSDASLKIFYVLVAIGRPLAESGCGLRFCAARRIVIDCFLTTQSITFYFVHFFVLSGLRSVSVVLLVFLRQDESA